MRRFFSIALSLGVLSLSASGCGVQERNTQPPERKGSGTKIIQIPDKDPGKADPQTSTSSGSPNK